MSVLFLHACFSSNLKGVSATTAVAAAPAPAAAAAPPPATAAATATPAPTGPSDDKLEEGEKYASTLTLVCFTFHKVFCTEFAAFKTLAIL